MNKERMEGKFEQLKGKIKQTWDRLTDDEIDLYNGRQQEFFGKLLEKHGVVKEEAEKTIKELEEACDSHPKAA